MQEKALATLNMLGTLNIEQILTFHKHFRMIKYSEIYVFIMHQLKAIKGCNVCSNNIKTKSSECLYKNND